MSFHGHSCPSIMIIFSLKHEVRAAADAASRVIGLLPTTSAFTVKHIYNLYIFICIYSISQK